MSDVSGIPYMGPQGVGNLYAPLFPASGMSTPSASQISYNWAPQGAYGQNVIDNLYSSGGGFGKQTDYYSQLGANYSAAGMSPWGVFTDAGMTTGRGAGGAPFPVSYYGGSSPDAQSGMDAFIHNSGGMGGGGGTLSVNNPSIDWTHLFSGGMGGGGSSFTPQSSTFPSTFDFGGGGGMFGGLAGGMGGANQGPNNAMDWTHLFSGGGAQQQTPQQPTDYGSLFGAGFSGAPNAAPAQQQPVDYGSLFGRGVGGSAVEPDPRANEPTVADPNRVTYGGFGTSGGEAKGGATSALPDYMTNNQLPADLRPSAPPETGSRVYDFAPMFEGGGGGGLGTGGGDTQLFGANNSGSLGGDAFSANPYAMDWGQDKTTPGPSADALAAQARARLADLISGAPDKAAEETAKAVPTPQERPGNLRHMDEANRELHMTPQEQALYERHLSNLYGPGGVNNPPTAEEPHESRSTLYQANVEIGGKNYNIPTVYDGKIVSVDEAVDRAKAQGLDNFPSYATPEEADARYMKMHDYMDRDVGDYFAKHGGSLSTPEGPPAPPAAASPTTDSYPGANPPRPPADIPGTNLTNSPTLKGVNPRLVAAVQGGAQYLPPGYRVEAVSGVREGTGQSYHSGGRAMDVKIIGPDGPIPHKGADDSGMYTLLARGVRTYTLQNDPEMASRMGYGGAFGTQLGGGGVPDLMHYDLGGSRGNMVPDMQFAGLKPLSAEEQGAMPANIPLLGDNQVALDPRGAGPIGTSAAPPLETRPGVNQGQDITPPPANIPDPRVSSGGFNALDAAANVPKGPSGVEKSQTFLNRPLENILQQYAPDKISQAGMFIDLKQSLREALKGPFGSQILEGLQPKLGDVGLTRSDFAKAVANPAARFGGDFGSTTGGEPTAGAFSPYSGFRESTNFEDRRDETPPGFFGQLADTAVNKGRDIADLFSSQPEPDAMSRALGFDDIMTTPFTPETETAPEATSMRDFQSPANDYNVFQQPASRADLASLVADPSRAKMDFSGFSPSPEQRSGGVGPPISLTPEFLQTIKQAESGGDPDQVTGSYKGLYQLNDEEFRKYGGQGSIFDPEQNTKAASAKMTAEGQRVADILGRDLSPVEQYMVHQQGVGGALAHLRNPDQPAWQSMRNTAEGQQKGDAWAKAAIWGNLSPAMKAQFGSVNNITSRDFIDLWTTKYQEKAVESGLPMTFPGGFSASR